MNRCLLIVDHLNPLSPTGEVGSFAEKLRLQGDTVRVIESSRLFQRRRLCTLSLRRLHDQIKTFRPDKIYCWGPQSLQVGAWLKRIPVAWTGALGWWACRATQWNAIHTSATRLLSEPAGITGALHYSCFDRHHFRTEPARHAVQQQFPKWRTLVLPWTRRQASDDGIDFQLRRRLSIPDDATVIGTAAELVPRSRIKDFIWAGDLMSCIRDDVYWLVIGQGQQKTRLQRFAGHLEIGDNLRFLDWHENSDRIVAQLNMYVQMSTYDDSCIGMRHALANGVPVIATSAQPHRCLVNHGVNGFVVEQGAGNEIARCANRLINQPEIAASFSVAAKRTLEAMPQAA